MTNYQQFQLERNGYILGKRGAKIYPNKQAKSLPTGTLIYSFGTIKVTQHEDGYVVTNGYNTIVLSYLPVLNASVLRVMLQENSIDRLEREEEENGELDNTIETLFDNQMYMAELYDANGY